nr:huntingtin-like [Lepeophtheirus salmonis]
MDKVIKAAVRTLSSASTFDTAEESPHPDHGISLESILRSLDKDVSAQSRILEEENLNKIIYFHSRHQKSSSKVLEELCKEIKRNSGARSLKICLGALSHINIKPQKLGPTISNILPCIIKIVLSENDPENVLSALSEHINPFLKVFGPYALLNEVEVFVNTFIHLLFNGDKDQSPSQRRSISICLCAAALHNKAPNYFVTWTFCRLVSEYIENYHNKEDISFSALLGLFTVSRKFIPLLNEFDDLMNNTFHDTELEKRLFTLYELCLFHLELYKNSSPNLISTTLELLHQILKTPPQSLKVKLLSTQGFNEKFLVGRTHEDNNSNATFENDPSSSKEDPTEENKDKNLSSRKIYYDEGGLLGSYMDKDIPLIYAARLIVSKTLLTPTKGVPRSDIRISIRSLAISCMSAIVSLSPKIFLLTLYVDQDEEDFDTTPLLRDIASMDHFVLHEDPQLSGSTAILLGNVLRGCLLETGGNGIDFWFNQRRPDHQDIIAIFIDLISKPNISSISIKYALTAICSFIGLMLRSSIARQAGILLFEVVSNNNSLWKNSYWLVKTSLLDLLSSVDFKQVHFVNGKGFELQNKFFIILKELFVDEDTRVRLSAADAIVRSIPNLYYPHDWLDECTEYASRNVSSVKVPFDSVIQRVADWLWQMIATSDNNFQLSGSLEAYFNLKKTYSFGSVSIDTSILDIITHFITSNSNFTLDINNHTLSLNLLNLIITGDVSKTKNEVLQHCARVLNMIHCLIEESNLSASVSMSSSCTTNTSYNSSANIQPLKKRRRRGRRFTCWKFQYHQLLQKNDTSNKFNLLLKSCLKTLDSLLINRCIENMDEELAKELLCYLSSTIYLDPLNSLNCVQSMLSYISKKTNEESANELRSSDSQEINLPDNASFYKYCFDLPYQEFVSRFQLPKPSLNTSISFFDEKINLKKFPSSLFKRALTLRNCNRDALTSYIRLFEPIVIQALQFYIITSKVSEQSQVLSLLIQLVKLRVNYCLLDSDKVFVGYVIRHLEYIKDGQVHNAEVIIPKIFQFFVLLSVEKFHSKVVIPIEDIVRLLTQLTSTKNPKWIIPAVYPVIELLFGNFQSHDNLQQADLEVQREKVFNLLLDYMIYPEILEVFVSILCFVKSEGEDKWRKVSRILFDNILSLLSTQKINLHDSNSLHILYSFFLCLAPGTLRPVDSLLSSVLTSSVDLGLVQDVQRWLGFVVVSLCIITNQSPEEGILSRLEEFGITLISAQHSLNEDGDSVKPESTFAKFLFQVIGASLSKLHQIVYSLEQWNSYLEEEVSLLLNFVIYVLKSTRFCRVTKSAQLIAEGKEKENLLYSLEFIDNMALELSHAYPFVTLRWAWILSLLKRVQIPFWSKLVSFNSHFLSLDKAILQKGSLIVLCDYLCETNPMDEYNVELVTWLVSNFSHIIVENISEEPICRFVQSVHNKASLSGLFLQAIISRCQHRLTSSVLFQKKTLIALEQVHDSHSFNLLTFLIQRFSPRAHLSLSTRIQRLCCKRVDGILNSGSPRELLSAEELSHAIGHLKEMKLTQRYGRLIALLNELISEWYPDLISPMECDDGRAFTPTSLIGMKPNKVWFLSQLRNKCSVRDSQFSQNTEQCARMLDCLNSEEDISSVISSADFNISIFEWLFRDSSTSALLLKTCKTQFFQYHLKKFADKYLTQTPIVYGPRDWNPSVLESRYKEKMDSNFSCKIFRDILTKSLSIFSLIPPEILNYEDDIVYLKRIPLILALEFAKWLFFYCTESGVKGKEELHEIVFKALDYVLKNPRISSKITMEEGSLAVHAVFSVLRGDEDIAVSKIPTCSRYKDILKDNSPKNSIVLAALKINRLFALYLKEDEEKLWKNKYLKKPISNIILGLARLPHFISYVSVPIEVWKLGWSDGVPFGPNEMKFPLLSLDHLQEIDILREYTIRVNAIGWSDRLQFEETWMSLLGIFSVMQDELSENDIHFLNHCSALVVRTATNLLLKTLCIPNLGLTNTSGLLRHSRHVSSEFISTSQGKALIALQDKMNKLLKDFRSASALPINSSINLEDIYDLNRSYGCGQVSSNYILATIKYYEGKAFENNANDQSLPICFLQREEALANSGLDMDSCLHFLFDLYSSWFKNPGETPLVLLTEAVRSIVALSDIFTAKNSFQWMYLYFCEILKVHPMEDEIIVSLLRLGICKAISVLGVSILLNSDNDAEALLSEDKFKRLLESGYNSPYLPSRFSSLQGVLYILQRKDLLNDNNYHLFSFMVRNSIEYLENSLPYLTNPCHDYHAALCWSLTFYILENYEEMANDVPWTTNVLQLALCTPGKTNTSTKIYLIILSGFERLILAGKLTKRYPGSGIRAMDQVVKLTTDLLTESNPVLVIPSIQLFLSTMYGSGSPAMNAKSDDGHGPSTPERLMHAMEQMSILFDCIRRSGPKEAHFLCQILPCVLVDFFPAADIINRVITEFISPGQPHQTLLAGVMFSVFKEASQEHSNMLQDWVLTILPTFVKRSPISHSAWCLSCFFLCVPPLLNSSIQEESQDSSSPFIQSDYWLQALFPHLQTRLGSFSSEDKKLFCLVAKEFYSHLQEETQREKFILAFKEVAHPKTPYHDLLQMI